MSPRGLVLAASRSGSGKTLVALALTRAFARQGVRVATAKSGPDFLDPGFLSAAAGRPSRTLDAWAMAAAELRGQAWAAARDCELLLVEGALGLFDGTLGGEGSTAALAKALGFPVLLLLEVAGQGQSAAALAEGFARFDPELALAGLLFNRVATARHRKLIEEGLAERRLPPALGWLPEIPALTLPSRHLGLVQASEHPALEELIERAADWISAHGDLPGILARAAPLAAERPPRLPPLPPLGQRIAIARDQAFSFVYEHVLAGWRDAGAELRFFSPLADEAPGTDADAVYVPGGYPELHAGRLAQAGTCLRALREAAQRGAVLYGECGGYMFLGRGLEDGAGHRHRLAGLLPLETSFAKPRRTLGYRRPRLSEALPWAGAGTRFRAHEFHYAATLTAVGPPLFALTDAQGEPLPPAGLRQGRVAGSFLHLLAREPSTF